VRRLGGSSAPGVRRAQAKHACSTMGLSVLNAGMSTLLGTGFMAFSVRSAHACPPPARRRCPP
jgi:hypothetical protein